MAHTIPHHHSQEHYLGRLFLWIFGLLLGLLALTWLLFGPPIARDVVNRSGVDQSSVTLPLQN
jgi:hypothetical protein